MKSQTQPTELCHFQKRPAGSSTTTGVVTLQARQGKRWCGISSTTTALTQGDTLPLDRYEPWTWTLVRVQQPRTPSPQVYIVAKVGGVNLANEWQVSGGHSCRRWSRWWNRERLTARRDDEVKAWRKEGAEHSHQQRMWWVIQRDSKPVQRFIRWAWMEKGLLTTDASSSSLLRFTHVGWVFPQLFKRRLFCSRPVFMAWMAKLFLGAQCAPRLISLPAV